MLGLERPVYCGGSLKFLLSRFGKKNKHFANSYVAMAILLDTMEADVKADVWEAVHFDHCNTRRNNAQTRAQAQNHWDLPCTSQDLS
jgi:hypothetical protein